jgi:DNA repair ATPase RecN
MKKFIFLLVAAFQRGRDMVRYANTPGELIARIKSLDCNFSPSTKRVSKLCLRLDEIAKQAHEAYEDIFSAFNHGEDVHSRVADLRLVFNRYEKCFSELSVENSTLAQAAKIYAERLDHLIGNPP